MNQCPLVNLVGIFKVSTLIYKTSYFKRMSEQQGKAADSFKSVMTVSDKSQIASYKFSELIA